MPCKPHVNMHLMYREQGTTDRKDVSIKDFRKWVDWAKENGYGMDFNVSFFTHPMMKYGCSLASDDMATREYWIEAGINDRKLANEIVKELGETCVNNIWIPDGMEDVPANRFRYRDYLEEGLDRILENLICKDI